jgi:hypothetical protein
MRKGLGFFAGGLAFLAMLGGAQAKMVRYEINGQRYSYNTNNRQQVEEARRRLGAANAAYAARLKAEAERASNPLAAVLGSPTQRETAEALARLRHVMSSSPPAEPAAGSETGRRAAAAERTRVAREPTPRKEAIPGFVPRAEPERPGKPHKVAARPKRSAPVETTEKPATPKSAKVAARPKPTAQTREPAVRSVHFDPDTGIKTTLMTDGTVHEESFEPRAAAGSRQGGPKTEDVTSGLHKLGKAEPKN